MLFSTRILMDRKNDGLNAKNKDLTKREKRSNLPIAAFLRNQKTRKGPHTDVQLAIGGLAET